MFELGWYTGKAGILVVGKAPSAFVVVEVSPEEVAGTDFVEDSASCENIISLGGL